MDLALDLIYFEGEARLRQDYGDLPGLIEDLLRNGQLQDILVRPFDPKEHPEISGKEWTLIDGGRRYLAFKAIYAKDWIVPELEPGLIGAKLRPSEEKLRAMVLEYQANSRRQDFNWREQAIFIRRIHDGMIKQEGNKVWGVKQTAEVVGKSKESIYKYLTLTKDPEIFNHPKVKKAESFVAAYRQYEIFADQQRRASEAQAIQELSAQAKEAAKEKGMALPDKGLLADEASLKKRAYAATMLGDARKWIRRLPDNTFDWFHWDPPYGFGQSGGPDPVHEEFDDNEEPAWDLIKEVVPEIHRTLRDGSWLAIWYSPPFYHRLVALLKGHRFNNRGTCSRCEIGWDSIHLEQECSKSSDGFWVNPYPFTWYKINRGADAHEIRRYCVNASEHFLLACKREEKDVILPFSGSQNVLCYPMVSIKIRRHVTHKPLDMLAEILEIISVPGSFGGDCGTGSGSIYEAAFGLARDMKGIDLTEPNYHASLEAATKGLKNWGQLLEK